MGKLSMTDKLSDRRKRGWYWIDNEVIDLYAAQIGPYGIAAYNVIARYCDGNQENSFPSYNTIAAKSGMSRRKAIDAVECLVSAGLVLKEVRKGKKGNTSNLYSLATPSAQDALPSAQDALWDSAQDAPDQDKSFEKEKNNKTGGGVLTIGDAFKAYENICLTFNAMESDNIKDLCDDYGIENFIDAVKVAVKRNAKNLAYVEGVLKRWAKNGKDTGSKAQQTAKTEADQMDAFFSMASGG